MKPQHSEIKTLNAKGFTLIELMMAMTIVLVVLGILSSIIIGMNSQLKTQRVRIESVGNAQTAADSMIRLIRMAGSRPTSCASSFVVNPLSVSTPLSNGYFATLTMEADWNQPDCNLNGVDEKVTFSVKNNIVYIDAAQNTPFVDKIAALRFKLYDENKAVITSTSLAGGAKFIRIEIDTTSADGSIATIVSGASLRK